MFLHSAEVMETVGYLLLTDVQGTKIVKRYLTGKSKSPTRVLRGELLLGLQQENQQLIYQLSHDPTVHIVCDENDVAPLNFEEFHMLEAIQKPFDRVLAFNANKLEWGLKLKQGSAIYIDIPGPGDNRSAAECARAVVHYKGQIGSQPGIQFGVELMVSMANPILHIYYAHALILGG